jgi:hypothetical protein
MGGTNLEQRDHGSVESSEVLRIIGFEEEDPSDGEVEEEEEDEEDDVEESDGGGGDGSHNDVQLGDPTQQPQQTEDSEHSQEH